MTEWIIKGYRLGVVTNAGRWLEFNVLSLVTKRSRPGVGKRECASVVAGAPRGCPFLEAILFQIREINLRPLMMAAVVVVVCAQDALVEDSTIRAYGLLKQGITSSIAYALRVRSLGKNE